MDREQRTLDLLVGAFEGGSNYWVKCASRRPYDYPAGIMAPGVFRSCTITDAETGKTYTLNKTALRRGLKLFHDIAPRHYGDWLKEDYDATTADVFLQLCTLGEIVYG